VESTSKVLPCAFEPAVDVLVVVKVGVAVESTSTVLTCAFEPAVAVLVVVKVGVNPGMLTQ
jgi:hypothetical protein